LTTARSDRERLASDIVDAWLKEKRRWSYATTDFPAPGYAVRCDGVKTGWLPRTLEWRDTFDAMVNRACARAVIEVME